ncbi:DUF2075 family protein/adenylate kinase [Lysinibacillus composti]|uniref:DUF2075 domain-containing protein n=1 Tax=Lysinibacillus composti TaxID=720633 RepID=A0A3N9U989_9BACI|nr:DUF2075 domain-containing protein [Lysinibacillus composti]MBM7610146.1 DUF2075 family protein/adenylate kinase [Lysinibacillus composti]RQW73209.1 DUF2075 domain-containing protein [Lysinibacillus composti]
MENLEIVTWPFQDKSLNQIGNNESYLNYPVIYILNGSKEAYIGETVYFKKRMRSHIKNKERKSLEYMHLIKHEEFNRSATFHLETKLINYFLGDEKYKLQNKSKTTNDFTHNYFNKPFYDQGVFKELWIKLFEKGIVANEQHVIENKDIFKLSPFKELSLEQIDLKEKVIEFCEAQVQLQQHEYGSLFVIKGEAGVGKSVVLSSIFNTIQEQTTEASSPLYKTENYLVVNHEEMYKTYKGIASQLKHLKAKNFAKPTPLINQLIKQDKKVDIILVDEAHLLLTRPDTYNNFHAQNQLEELLKLAKVVVMVYDSDQVLKLKSLWQELTLEILVEKSSHTEYYELTNQFRMQANDEVIEWINQFKQKRLLPLPYDEGYEFKVFVTLKEMHEAIKTKNNEYGLSRVVSTFDYLHKKDGGVYYITEDRGEYQIPWNITDSKFTWAEKASTVNEAGSIYTIQGFDLNYVGVILGPSISYDEQTDRLVIKTEAYKDVGAYSGTEGIENVEAAKERIILNSVNILMKRGIKGLYIYASDEALRNKLIKSQSKIGENEE